LIIDTNVDSEDAIKDLIAINIPFFDKLTIFTKLTPEAQEVYATPELLDIKFNGIHYIVNIEVSMPAIEMLDLWHAKLQNEAI